ncbi:MAG TPA: dipeptidase PepE [Terriglobia bacterium]|nr:dipeptidase PepE [Terriglobia bacterium]
MLQKTAFCYHRLLMSNRRMLLFSNGSDLIGRNPTDFAQGALRAFLGTTVKRILFVPFATVVLSQDDYLSNVRRHFGPLGYDVESFHNATDPREAIKQTDAIAVGGGNTFHLLRGLYRAGVIELIRERAEGGMPYVGWSAGSNVACPTIRTTNDMPIVEPPGLDAIGLVPFQINPHYTDARIDGHMGETRDERLLEFVTANPTVPVIGLREGTMLRIEGDEISLLGGKPARLFRKGEPPRDLLPDESLKFLLDVVPA